MEFVRNTWYAAGWSEEISRTMLPRTFLNEPVLLYRKEDGTPVAIADLCPHRFVPLSLGKLVGDTVECLYHGLAFDCTGKCVDNPHGNGLIPKAARVRSYPLTEQYGLVWIWMGDPVLADPALVPDFVWLNTPEKYRAVHGTINLKANYLLVMDNLTDLSHAGFVHVTTLEPRELAKASYEVIEEEGRVWTKQFVPSMPVPPLMNIVKGFTGVLDHWLEMRCDPPGCMITYYGFTTPGRPREEGWGTYNPNIITPETDNTTHYFWGSARDFDLDDEEITQKFEVGAAYAFEHEDRPIIEAQQKILQGRELMDLKPVLLQNDQGSGRARRIITRKIKEERAAAEAIHDLAEQAVAAE
ncbi:aromatic ring-hydroxylating dioxygenase subunit alpha [Sphingobium sp. H39-3-25]|uniref:aromatic ring-hydroxylating dioxygenase subunit alpha n=1 Tax=Sphingomonadales TaxID=204457 RepID=UPI000829E2E9|nr:aromatic ring-hydroxylating dioxygenase subunit alpha [Novosphingobium naphthalenivorans]MDF0546644.1 aromatic ring-hydroxylating dioxygenase subunit alpha [Sphingobium arseniciresistens]